MFIECNNFESPTKPHEIPKEIPQFVPSSYDNSPSFDSYSADIIDSALFCDNSKVDPISEYSDKMILHLENNEKRYFQNFDDSNQNVAFLHFNRSQFIDWLTCICYDFEFTDETLFNAIYIFDHYITITKSEENSFIAAVCSLWISIKLNETMIPTLEQIVFICNNRFTKNQIRTFEMIILNTLSFDIVYPTPTRISDSLLSQVPIDETFEKYVSLFCHCALFCEELIGIKPSHISLASIVLAKIATDTRMSLNVIIRSLSLIHEATLIHCLKCISLELKKIFQSSRNAIQIKFEQYIVIELRDIDNIIKKLDDISSENIEIFLDNI